MCGKFCSWSQISEALKWLKLVFEIAMSSMSWLQQACSPPAGRNLSVILNLRCNYTNSLPRVVTVFVTIMACSKFSVMTVVWSSRFQVPFHWRAVAFSRSSSSGVWTILRKLKFCSTRLQRNIPTSLRCGWWKARSLSRQEMLPEHEKHTLPWVATSRCGCIVRCGMALVLTKRYLLLKSFLSPVAPPITFFGRGQLMTSSLMSSWVGLFLLFIF